MNNSYRLLIYLVYNIQERVSHVEKFLYMTIYNEEKTLHMTDFLSTSAACGAWVRISGMPAPDRIFNPTNELP